jgi:hypothetical protein
MSDNQEKRFGVPVDEFVKNGKQANAKAQVNQTLKIFNDAVKAARAEGVFVFLKVDTDEADGRPLLGASFETNKREESDGK